MLLPQSVHALATHHALPQDELRQILQNPDADVRAALFAAARATREAVFGKAVWLRGLIEFSSHCQRGCLYCGLRAPNALAQRYRLTDDQILACCAQGFALGFKSFVLQSGEDPYYNDDRLCALVRRILQAYPGCAVTLSLGERPRHSLLALRKAGAQRYLLRHESIDAAHYASLHPPGQTLATRLQCLQDLRDLGFVVGCGFMVGSPGQTMDHLLQELAFLQDFKPEMVGLGPFLPHSQTPFAAAPPGDLPLTLTLLAVIRLLLPTVLLPATTALGTAHPTGREQGLRAGCNVLMPNLSPVAVRRHYLLYDGKICTGEEAAECRHCLQRRVESTGYFIESSRGDPPGV